MNLENAQLNVLFHEIIKQCVHCHFIYFKYSHLIETGGCPPQSAACHDTHLSRSVREFEINNSGILIAGLLNGAKKNDLIFNVAFSKFK